MGASGTTGLQRTALITGASRGLGLVLARALAAQGWHLVLDARGAEALEAAHAELAKMTAVVAIAGDVGDSAHRARLAEAVRAFGGLDALVNNASVLGPSPRPNLLEYPLDALETVFRVNVLAPLALVQTLAGDLKPGARILNVTSDAAVQPYAGWGGYGASKAALEQLTAILAAERPDWRVYWVDPGDMRTQMQQDAFPGEDISDRPLPDASVPGFLALLTGDLPSGRYQAQALAATQGASPAPAPHPGPVHGMRLVLTVPDFERAAEFYRDGLGLEAAEQWIGPESKGILFRAGKASLEIVNAAQAAEVNGIETGRQGVGMVRLAFRVDDSAGMATRLVERGARALSEAVMTPWGHLNVRLQAPDGLPQDIELTLSQVAAPEAESV
ncbi:MAG: SDR family NAD(P)-dependent oxidoreductase [Anaerolineae bacterium]|nr:SDR family NAD(P)-dependent oxidoreductase [Anaerolineae bacterium]